MAERSGAPYWNSLLQSRWDGFARWWLAGLRDTLPARWRSVFLSTDGPAFVIEQTGTGYLCRVLKGTERQFAPETSRSGADALAACLLQTGLRREQVLVGLLMDRSMFFTRDIAVPDAAISALPRLLDQEVLRRTPFRLSDIQHGATLAVESRDAVPGVTSLRHWIIRRDLIDAAIKNASLNVGNIDILFTRDINNLEVPAVRLGSSTGERPSAKRHLTLAASIAFICTLLALFAADQAQENKAERLAAALADMKAQIHDSNVFTDAVGLLTIKADIGTAAALNELSKIIPDDTFLTELRLVDGQAEAAGFSSDAARLVRLVDKSPIFKDAGLAGAIEPNAAEGREHFSLKADLRTGQMLRLHAATGRTRSVLAEELQR